MARHSTRKTEAARAYAARKHDEGMSVEDIAVNLGMRPRTVQMYVTEHLRREQRETQAPAIIAECMARLGITGKGTV